MKVLSVSLSLSIHYRKCFIWLLTVENCPIELYDYEQYKKIWNPIHGKLKNSLQTVHAAKVNRSMDPWIVLGYFAASQYLSLQ